MKIIMHIEGSAARLASKSIRRFFRYVICATFLSLVMGRASSQSNRTEKIKVYFDCNAVCDLDYIRSEINMIDYVQDRLAADLHILVTVAKNGADGSNYQLMFFGQGELAHMIDTLEYSYPINTTVVEAREKMLKVLQRGLLPYIAKTVYIQKAKISLKLADPNNTSNKKGNLGRDKWNYWVFSNSLDGDYIVDEVYSIQNLKASSSINRTTPSIRVNFSAEWGKDVYAYEYTMDDASYTYKVNNTNYSFGHFLYASMSKRWSLGYNMYYNNSTFSNNRRRMYGAAGIEYSIFPYEQVNTRFFTINYRLEARHNSYYDTTIYNKIQEALLSHQASINLSLKQKWGNINASAKYSFYQKDRALNNLSMKLYVDLRITGNISVYLFSYGGLVHDQIYLPKGSASPEDVLARRRQLKSGYNLSSGIGLNFRFGSMLNNFVNPRFSSF